MSLRLPLAWLLGLVTLAVSAFAMPGAADAHPGHVHASGEVQAQKPIQGGGAAETPASADSLSAGIRQSHHVDIASEVADGSADREPVAIIADRDPSLTPANEAQTRGCVGMCCNGAPCGGCVSIVTVDSLIAVSLIRTPAPSTVDPGEMSGRMPKGPRKPPRTFI